MTGLNEEDVRRIIREEIIRAFGALEREAGSLDSYETAELDSRALAQVARAAEGAVVRLTCPHEEYRDWGYGPQPQCARCGEPEPQPVNPFEEKTNG